MAIVLLKIIVCYFVSTSLAMEAAKKGGSKAPDRRVCDECTEFVSDSMAAMAANHARDMQELKDLISAQSIQIQKLESDNVLHISVIRELEKKIGSVNTKRIDDEYDSNADQKSMDKRVTKDNTDEFKDARSENRGHRCHNRIRRASVETKVAFFATMTSTTLHLGENQDIVFDHAVTNIGSAYNEHHGTFVAPVSGTYVFSVTLYHQAGIGPAGTWGHFVVDGVVVAKLHVNEEQSSQTIVVNLTAGDDVSVQNTATDRAFFGDRYNSFSGFLLYENFSVGPIVG